MELVARAGKTPEPHAFEAVVNLQMSKAHLDALASIAPETWSSAGTSGSAC